jgi:hypothetical protein
MKLADFGVGVVCCVETDVVFVKSLKMLLSSVLLLEIRLFGPALGLELAKSNGNPIPIGSLSVWDSSGKSVSSRNVFSMCILG